MKLSVPMTRQETLFGWLYIPVQLLVLPSILAVLLLVTPMTDTQLNLAFFVVNFLAVLLIFHKFLHKSLLDAKEKLPAILMYAGLDLAAYFVLSSLVGALILHIDPAFANANDSYIADMAEDSFLAVALPTVFLVPITEELLYRGILFGSLYRKHPVLGYTVSVAIFAAIHVVGYVTLYPPQTLLLCFLQYLPAGICLNRAYEQSGSIFAPLLMHTVINALGILAMR